MFDLFVNTSVYVCL